MILKIKFMIAFYRTTRKEKGEGGRPDRRLWQYWEKQSEWRLWDQMVASLESCGGGGLIETDK